MDKKYIKAWKYTGKTKVTVSISDTGKKEDEKIIAKNIDEKKAIQLVKQYMKKGYASYERMREEAFDEQMAAKMIEDMLFRGNLKSD